MLRHQNHMTFPTGVASKRWFMFGQYGIAKVVILVSFNFFFLWTVTSQPCQSNSEGVCQKANFIEWQFGSEPWVFCKFIELSPEGRFVAALERGDMSWASVWKVDGSRKLGRKVYSTKGKDFFVQDIEWVGHYLLILVVDGIKTIADFEERSKGTEYIRSHSRILIWDSQSGTESDFLKGDFQLMFAHSKENKVLIFHRRSWRQLKENVGEYRVSYYSVPEGRQMTHFHLKLNSDLIDPLLSPFNPGGYPLFWCSDKKRFWMIDEHSEVHPVLWTLHVPILRIIGLNGENRIISGEPRQKWLIVKNSPFLVHEGPDGYDDVKGTISYLSVYGPPAVLVSGKLCGVAMAGWYRLRSIGFFNEERLVEEIPLERKRFEPLRRSLEQIGIKHCEIKALSPDGRRLVLQELKKEKGIVEDAFTVPFGEKRWVLVWDIKTQILRRVSLIGWIDEVYDWVDASHLIVRLKGLKMKTQEGHLIPTLQYGVLCLPDTTQSTKREKDESQKDLKK